MTLLTICLFFVAALGAHLYEPLNRVPQHLMEMRNSLDSHLELTRKMALQNASDCAAAFQALQTFTNNSACSADLQLVWSNTSADSVIDDYCAPDSSDSNRTCADKLELLMGNALLQCRVFWADNFTVVKEEVRKFLYLAKVPCVRDVAGHLCFKDFKHIGSVTNGTLTKAGLDSICTPCTAIVFGLMSQFAPAEFLTTGAYIETACHQLNGEYCILKFQNFANNNNSGGDPTAADLDMLCDPCVQTVMFRFAWLSTLTNDTGDAANLTKSLAWSAMVCQKDFSGSYCYLKLESYFDSSANELDNCNNTIPNPSTCPGSSCQKAIRDFRASQGCCVGTWINMLQVQYTFDRADYTSPLSPAQMRQFAVDDCGVDIPEGCAVAKLQLALVLAGIDPVWAAANQAQLETMLQTAIAYGLAIDAALVLVTVNGATSTNTVAGQSVGYHLQAANTISVTAQIQTTTDAQTAQGVSNGPNLSLLPSQLPTAALSDPTVGVVTQSAILTTVSNSGNDASSRSPASFLTVLLVALVALVVRV